MIGARSCAVDLVSVAQCYVDGLPVAPRPCGVSIAALADLVVRLHGDYCVEVAAYFDRAPRLAYGTGLRRRYERLKWENRRQYQAILDAGIEIVPWLGVGQPYRDSSELVGRVRQTGTLHVYLTRAGHGPRAVAGYHPLRQSSGIVTGGVGLSHNDVLRAVHDIFGHVMFGHSFGPRGEFKATYCHMQMYSEEVQPVLFTEHIGQVCWFFFGPHLLDRAGKLPTPDDPEYLPPARRPYPEQKVFRFPQRYLDTFKSMIDIPEFR